MSYKLSGLNPLAYMGVEPNTPAQTVVFDFPPTINDTNFNLGTLWLDTASQIPYELVSLANGTAVWISLGGGTANLKTLTTQDSVVVSPTAGNINIVGGTGVTTTGTTSTVTINVTNPVTFPITVAEGGTGDTSFTPYAVLTGGTTSTGPIQSIVSVGTSGQVLTSNGAGELPTFQASGGSTGHPLITTYSTPGTFTWTMAAGTTLIEVFGSSGGGGGGSGARYPNQESTGGGGGNAAGSFYASFPSTFVSSSEPVVVGAGGLGGSSVTSDNTAGNSGNLGGVSSFGNISEPGTNPVAAYGALQFIFVPTATTVIAYGGNINFPSIPIENSGTSITQEEGGQFNTQGVLGQSGGTLQSTSTASGGGGNGATTTPGSGAGLSYVAGTGGGILTTLGGFSLLGGTAGTTASPNGGNGVNAPTGSSAGGNFLFGSGGGGGFGQTGSSLPGTGGNGGFPAGGGGGGGSSLNGTNSGAGGNGANGIVYVIEW